MDASLHGSGGPLQPVSPNAVGSLRDSAFGHSMTSHRDSSVHDKISQFNNLSVSLQSKQLERKTADAALKRAMLGREEAEGEARRSRDEIKALRKAVEEGKERERRVGERLETVMENYGRAKETHAHTQALWEKEIRRARKETFKAQSSSVKLQEELKTARKAVQILEENVKCEKERCHIREQEAFAARYQIVGVQEQLDQALERIKVVEQERDAYKMAAQNEEVARIAAEGRIPLPAAPNPQDEFASPKKKTPKRPVNSRVSLTTYDIQSSEASEIEIEQLHDQVRWEKQRADRAQELIEFLQAEREMHSCSGPCPKLASRSSLKRQRSTEDVGGGNPQVTVAEVKEEKTVTEMDSNDNGQSDAPERLQLQTARGPRRSTIFCRREGVFRTVSDQEAHILEQEEAAEARRLEQEEPRSADESGSVSLVEAHDECRMYARTPSVEPPTFAQRTSLLSLLNAPHEAQQVAPMDNIPTMAQDAETEESDTPRDRAPSPPYEPGPPSLASSTNYTVTTTVPLRDENSPTDSSFSEKLRTPSNGSNASFDLNNPALTPTMTREQALAKIRERRGRARSAALGATPNKKRLVSQESNSSAASGGTLSRKPSGAKTPGKTPSRGARS